MCGAGLQTGPDLNCLVIVLAAPLHIPISKPASLSILCPKSPLPQIGPRPASPWSSPRPGHLLLPPKLWRPLCSAIACRQPLFPHTARETLLEAKA